ncbi:MAG: DUF3040 domain-containing protein [Acidimicrobiaceae bacterium]|nr:DUF3040 domain-containing protein [Acidimicrobiaceae bacterium]
MPLSEEEHRILQEIEKNFYDNDPDFATRVKSETVYRHAGRNIKWALLSFIAGLAMLILTFATSAVLGSIGFLVMLGSAVIFEQNLRRMGKAGWNDISSSVQGKGISSQFGHLSSIFGKRFGPKG